MRIDGNKTLITGKLTLEERTHVINTIKKYVEGRFKDIPLGDLQRTTLISTGVESVMSNCFEYNDESYYDLKDFLTNEFQDFIIEYFIKLTKDCIQKIETNIAKRKAKITLQGKKVKPNKKTPIVNIRAMF